METTTAQSFDLASVLATLKSLGNDAHRLSKARLGVPLASALGVSLPDLRTLAKKIKRNQPLANELWQAGYHEARLLAVLIADPKQITMDQVENWLADVVSWDLCDHLCNNLLVKVPICVERIPVWAADAREFVRRAAFALLVNDVIHNGQRDPACIDAYFGLLRTYAHDQRNYVKKAISWALRELGKRNDDWQARALSLATELSASSNPAERWVGNDALKELTSLVNVPGRRRKVARYTQNE